LKDARYHEAKDLLVSILALQADNTDALNLLEEVEHAMAQQINKEISL